MRRLILVALVLVVAGAALAGDNPFVTAYVSLDQTGAGYPIYAYQPAPYETFRAYVCYTQIEGGITVVSFRLTDVVAEYPGVFASPSFTNLLPGGLAIGSWNEGITLASTECVWNYDVCVGYLELVYVGGGGCIELLDHPEFPRWVVDCNDPGQVDYYRISGSGAVGDACCAAGEYAISVRCEPQGSPNPTHPPTYWYDAQLAADYAHGLRVQVFDPNPENYTNWVVPDDYHTWTYGLEQDGEGTWAFWRTDPYPLLGGRYMFGFDNPNLATWGHWELGNNSSADLPYYCDGWGYRVHVPTAATPVEQASWSTIKALFR